MSGTQQRWSVRESAHLGTADQGWRLPATRAFHTFSTPNLFHRSGGKPFENLILLAATVCGTNEFTTLHCGRCRGFAQLRFATFEALTNEGVDYCELTKQSRTLARCAGTGTAPGSAGDRAMAVIGNPGRLRNHQCAAVGSQQE